MRSRRYVLTTFITIALLLLTIGIFNITIDPYGIFNTPLIDGWNKNKPDRSAWFGYKAAAIKETKPDTIILGTSRTEIGIDPTHKAFGASNTYNAGIQHGDFLLVSQYFYHSINAAPLKKIIVGLDFHTFNSYNRFIYSFNASPFPQNSLQDKFLNTMNKAGMALNGHALIDSITTLEAQSAETIRFWLPQQRGMLNPMVHEERIKKQNGQRGLFKHEEQDVPERENFLRYSFSSPDKGNGSPIEMFRGILRTAYANNLTLYFFISPSHARYWEVIYNLGLWNAFEAWKRMLVTIMEEEAKIAHKPSFPLWDFSGYNSITTETVPSEKDHQGRMKWYWETSHYRKEAGDLILNKLFSINAKENLYPDFGTLINSENINQHILKTRSDRKVYIQQHPEDIKEVQEEIHNITRNSSIQRQH